MIILNNKYQFDPKTDLLGEGGFSRVYKARDILLERFVALKIANRSDLQSSYNYLDEIRRAIEFSHINIARYYDGFEYSEISFGEKVTYQVGVMEYLPEGILTHDIFRKLSPDEKKRLVGGILEGLEYLHSEKNIIHRDIKPSNILLAKVKGEYIPKIADFGISKQRGDKSAGISRIVGSFDYMAPEQFDKKKHIDFNTDLWAFGVLLYQLCLGSMPFSEESSTSEAEIIRNIVEKPVPGDIRKIPEPFRQIILRCLEKDRHVRAASATDLLQILNSSENIGVNPPSSGRASYRGGTHVLEETSLPEPVAGPPDEKEVKIKRPDRPGISRKTIIRTGIGVAAVILAFVLFTVVRNQVEKHRAGVAEKQLNISILLAKADSCFSSGIMPEPGRDSLLACLQEILKIDPGNEEAKARMVQASSMYLAKGDEAAAAGRWKEALEHYSGALVFAPGDTILLSKSETVKVNLDKSAAVTSAEKVPEREGTADSRSRAQEFMRQGDSLFRLKKYPDALVMYRQAQQMAPEDAVLASRVREADRLQGGGEAEAPVAAASDYLQLYNMVLIQGGTFDMGTSGSDGDNDEQPVHSVRVDAFYLGKYEVTVAQFKAFIDETGYRTDAEKEGWSYFMSSEGIEKKPGMTWRHNAVGTPHPASAFNHPVICVSWNDASEFCKWLSRKSGKPFRLPAETEWEYAARGGKNKNSYIYSGGNSLGTVGWFSGNAPNGTAAVGKKSPNSLGLYDMSGNVWEWCQSAYGSYPVTGQSGAGSSQSGTNRVLRGGGWYDDASACRVANRGNYHSGYKDFNTGFRLAAGRK